MGFFVLFFLGVFLIFAGLMLGFAPVTFPLSLIFIAIGVIGAKSRKSLRSGYTQKIKAKVTDDSKDVMEQAEFMARVNEMFYTYNVEQKALSMSGYANNLTEQDIQRFSGFVSPNQKTIRKNERSYQFGYLIFGEQNVFLYQFFVDNKIANNVSEKYDWINYREMINIIDKQGGFEIKTMVGKNYDLYIENVDQATYIRQCLYYKMQTSRG
ncbi:MAG: hypothetical protein IJX85_07145 [Lachnospiraceae bacterium]|nr:hypothetical protein [Lachnospiraceae bacterium]